MKVFGVFLLTISFLISSLPSHAQVTVSLQEAVKLAKSGNPVLKSEKLNISIAETDVITAGLRPNPALNNQTLQLVRPSLFPNDTRWSNSINRQVWWQLTKQFQWPALRQNKIEFARQGVRVIENNFNEFERNLTLDVATTWLDTWHIKQLLTTLQNAQLNVDSLVNIQKARLRNQVITATELLRTQILLEQYNLQLKTTRQEYLNSIQELKFMLGTSDSLDVSTDATIESFSISSGPDSLLRITLERRSDIKLIQSSIIASESNLKLQNSMKWPIPELGVIWNPQNTIPYLGFFGTIQVPLFSRNQGGISRATFEKQQAEQNLQTVQLRINTELTAAYQTYQLQKETLTRYSQILQQSNDVLRSVRYSYLRGGTTLIDLLEAQRSWYDTQQLYYDAQKTYYQSYLRLLYVTGLITQL